MAPLRLTTGCLIVFLLTTWLPNAYVHRGMGVGVGERFAAVAVDRAPLGGRTMAVVKPEKVKIGGTNTGRTSISNGSQYDGKCEIQAKKVMKSTAECNKNNNVTKFAAADEKE